MVNYSCRSLCFFSFHSYVCVVCMHVYMCADAHGGLRLTLCVFLDHSLSYFWGKVSQLNQALTDRPRPASQMLWGSAISTFPGLELQVPAQHLCGFWGSELLPSSCMASTQPQASPQPHLNYVFKKFFFKVCVPQCMYGYHMNSVVCGDQKKVLGSLELELHVIVSQHLGAENQT